MKHGCILLWPHGYSYKDQILIIISKKYKIIYHNSFKIDDLQSFVIKIYKGEDINNIRNKIKYLLSNNDNGKIYLYIFENEETDIQYYRKVFSSKGVKYLKNLIRNLYNPKLSNPEQRILPLDKGVSHDHIIHCTDTSVEVPYICNLLNITL